MTIKINEETREIIKQKSKAGRTGKSLAEEYKVSPSTITYILDPSQREKSMKRQAKTKTLFTRAVHNFCTRQYEPKKEVQDVVEERPERRPYFMVRSFLKYQDKTKGVDTMTHLEIAKKILWPKDGKDSNGYEYPYVSCAMTGRRGSVMAKNKSPERITLDHILSKHAGGENNLETNMQPLLQVINEMKQEHTTGDFFTMIKWIIEGPQFKSWVEKNEE